MGLSVPAALGSFKRAAQHPEGKSRRALTKRGAGSGPGGAMRPPSVIVVTPGPRAEPSGQARADGTSVAAESGVARSGTPGERGESRTDMRQQIASASPARVIALLAAAGAVVVAAGAASATIVGGGGSAKSDCFAVFDAPANEPARRPRAVRCTDGDPCDADGTVNGRCELAVSLCANSTADPRCASPGVSKVTVAHSVDDGSPGFDPEMQAVATRLGFVLELPETRSDRCAVPTAVHVAIDGPRANGRCRKGVKTIRVTTLSTPVGGRTRADVDRLKITCVPAPAGCDARAFFTSTFDRIQGQIFDRSCAVGGCHDSQSTQADLLLERGASYDNLVGKTPTNADAAAAGWRRVTTLDATHGDPATSYLFHKLTGDLPPGYGERMPLHGAKLDDTLVEVIRRWIEAGAPAEGWVPGTD